jgi:hypothetical protein
MSKGKKSDWLVLHVVKIICLSRPWICRSTPSTIRIQLKILVDLVKNKHDQKVTCFHHDVAENLFTRDVQKHIVHSRTPWGGGKS